MLVLDRPLVKTVYHKINFLISQPKHMFWVLKIIETVLLSTQTYVQTDGSENIKNFTLKNFVYLNLSSYLLWKLLLSCISNSY